MKILVSQIYVRPGVSYPFSHKFQVWISKALSDRVQASPAFLQKYSIDYKLIFRMSAKAELVGPEVKGPTVFKRTKDVEFTVFLPYSGDKVTDPSECEIPLRLFFQSVVNVLRTLSINSQKIEESSEVLIREVLAIPEMFEWPREE